MQRKVNNRTIANPKHDNLPESKCLPRRWCSPQLTESRGGNSRLRWFATSHRPAPRSASLQPIQRSRDAQRHAAAPLREQPTIRPRQSRTGDRGDGIRDHQGGDGIPAFPSAGTERGKWGMDADQPGMEPEADARSRKLSKKRKNQRFPLSMRVPVFAGVLGVDVGGLSQTIRSIRAALGSAGGVQASRQE